MKKIRFFYVLLLSACCAFSVQAQTTTINGLVVIVNFTDYAFNASVTDVSAMLNQTTGHTNWGNNGSVKQYFTAQTNGKVTVNSQVIAINVPNTFAFYHNNKEQLLRDLVANINTAYPAGFTNLTVHPTKNRLRHFAVLTRGTSGNGVSYEFDYGLSVLNNGSPVTVGNVAFAGGTNLEQPEINVICHELGHSIFEWTDFYHITHANSYNLGHYCLMGSGGKAGSPMPISPPLRNFYGWITTVNEINNNTTQTYSVVSNNSNQIYKYTNPYNAKEYFLITSYVHGGYYLAVDGDGYTPDQGLAIWYVDEERGLNKPDQPIDQLGIKLVQADGMNEMMDATKTHHDLRGDDTDLFDASSYSAFSDALYPGFKWKDGSETGLNITNISAIGATMTFKVNARPGTINAAPATNGKILPSGLITVPSGQSKTISFVPDMGYAVDQVTINGVAQGAITSYTFPTVSGTQNVTVTFKTSSAGYALPSPWQSGDIGTISPASVSGYKNGTFGITTSGDNIYWSNDQFHYIYRQVTGNTEIIARVASNNKPGEWSKSGIMIRESLADNAKHVMLVKAPWHGIVNQYRINTAGESDNFNQDTLKTPKWLKLNRSGNTITSSYSYDGISWTTFNSVTVSMTNNVYVGLCAAGINSSLANKSTYDNVKVNGVLVNFAPTIAITSPANNAVFTAPASFTVNVNATDADGSIAKVEFYRGMTYLGNDLVAPYTFNITNLAAGTYAIRTVAYDNNNTTSEVTINVVVNNPGNQLPVVNITSPANNANFTAPANFTINATATDADGSVSKVEFYRGLTYLGNDLVTPYAFNVTNLAAGTYSIRVVAYDNNNATAEKTINVVVNGTATCTTPAWNAATAYSTGNTVSYNGIKYIANWWTQGQNPSTNNGGSGSGQPWTSQGNCTSRTSADETVAVNNNLITIAPNPVLNQSIVFLELSQDEENIMVDIIDSFGKKTATIYQGALQGGEHALDLNSALLAPGMYILRVKSQYNNQNKVFIKQ